MLYGKIDNSIKSTGLLCLLALLSACNGKAAENWFGADPQLQQRENRQSTPSPKTEETVDQQPSSTTPANSNSSTSNSDEPPSETETQVELPPDFPPEIPIYPQATLLRVDTSASEQSQTIWRSPDPSDRIISYYQQQFAAQDWQFRQSASNSDEILVASKDNLEITLLVGNTTSESTNTTQFSLTYQPNIKPQTTPDANPQPSAEAGNTESELAASKNLSDFDQVPEQLQQYVEDVVALGIFSSAKTDTETKSELKQFAPNEAITRRDFARWLVAVNNQYYANSPGKKIHLATKSSQPAFQDVGVNDPDFEVIQGLAEAGLIPSMLTNQSDQLLFQPDAPLTREDLLTWKVPLDIRKALPKASIDTIRESWGFQDAQDISPLGLRALFADFQNGEQANVRRAFGYTTLFQPKKPVTRAEAAASLWYLGFQGDGITAQEIAQAEAEN